MRGWFLRPGALRPDMARQVRAAMHHDLSVRSVCLHRESLQIMHASCRVRWKRERVRRARNHDEILVRMRCARTTRYPNAAGACPATAAAHAVGPVRTARKLQPFQELGALGVAAASLRQFSATLGRVLRVNLGRVAPAYLPARSAQMIWSKTEFSTLWVGRGFLSCVVSVMIAARDPSSLVAPRIENPGVSPSWLQ